MVNRAQWNHHVLLSDDNGSHPAYCEFDFVNLISPTVSKPWKY